MWWLIPIAAAFWLVVKGRHTVEERFNVQLSENFNLTEFIAAGDPQRPGPDEIEALRQLAVYVLQPIRDQFGPIRVTSGYRSPTYNRMAGSTVEHSQHVRGEAADIKPMREGDFLRVADWIAANIVFDQLILEHHDGERPFSGWIHISHRKDGTNQRKEVLSAQRDDSGRTRYYEGLLA